MEKIAPGLNKKVKLMTIDTATNLKIDNEVIEVVDNFYLLGLTIKSNETSIKKYTIN